DGADSENEKPSEKSTTFKALPFMDENIHKELSFFMSLHKNALFHIVEEDFMNFRYRKGDCVAGEEDNLKNLEGCFVIAQQENGKTVLCKLIHCLGNECEIAFAKRCPTETLKIARAAEIVWHRMVGKSKRKV
ncbi:MAG: hypothetical protein LBJ96_05225, partial [Holosporaceae bacterium]|nr:hypothetical protein [Holosporaceae bacterium]